MTELSEIWTKEGFQADPWQRLDDEEALPEDGAIVVSAERWSDLRGRNTLDDWEVGVAVGEGDPIEDLIPDLDRIAMVSLSFPAFTDGRAYSSARLLRERHGYEGEIRAEGDVLLDQIPYMLRCGFSSFAIRDEATRRALADGHIPEVPIYMQPTGSSNEAPFGNRPWMRSRS